MSILTRKAELETVNIEVEYRNACHQVSGVKTWKNDIIVSATGFLQLITDHPEVVKVIHQPGDDLQESRDILAQLKFHLIDENGEKSQALFIKEVFQSKTVKKALDLMGDEGLHISFPTTSNNTRLAETFIVFKLPETKKSFFGRLKEKINPKKFVPEDKVDKMLIVTTPFAQKALKGTKYYASSSNIIDKVLTLVNIPLPQFSEGSIATTTFKVAVGWVINTYLTKSGLVLAAPLVANITPVLSEYYQIRGMSKEVLSHRQEFYNSIVLVESGRGSHGTGCLVLIGKTRFILTCSHVITDPLQINITWKKKKYPVDLIYKNPIHNQPYDIALLEAPDSFPKSNFCQLAKDPPKIGTKVVTGGFGLFGPTMFKLGIANASIFEGRIINSKPGMLVTDMMVHSGHSGGPIFNLQNELLGIITSNADFNGDITPTFNFAVPVASIRQTLIKFESSKDRSVLKKLEADEDIQRVWNLQEPIVKSKL